MSCFFIEGASFRGKSSLLKQQLLVENRPVSGFFVERIRDFEGKICAFELKDAAELFSSKKSCPENWFIWQTSDGTMQRNLKVFETFGCYLLEKAALISNSYILLDEIGGIELLAPAFYEQLLKLFLENRQIVGVFKSEENYQRQKLRSHQPLIIDEQREKLRKNICRHGKLLTLQQENYSEVKKALQQFLIV